MKILLINSYYYPEVVGGAEMSVKKLAEELVKLGHEVSVICSTQYNNDQQLINGVKVFKVKPNNFGRREDLQHADFSEFNRIKRKFYASFLYNRKWIYAIDTFNIANWNKIASLIKTIKPDIIHTNGLYEITPVVWSIAHKYKIPVVHTLRDYYLLCIYGNMKKKAKYTCNNITKWCNIRRNINRKLLKRVNVFTSPSNATKKVFEENKMRIEDRTYVVSNAIDFDNNQIRSIYEHRKLTDVTNKLKVIFIGTLSEFKGVNFLLEQWKKLELRNVELHIAGKGPLEEKIKLFCNDYKNVIYHGFLDESELNVLLLNCDVLVCPSLWNEPFGRIVLDAYKQVMPVISTGYGGLGEIIDHEETGYILDLDLEKPLQTAIQFYMNKKNYIYALESIMKKVEHFSIHAQAKSFEKIYKLAGYENDN